MRAEEWRPVPGFEGLYEVSDAGRVRSLDRVVKLYNGGQYVRKGKLMTPTLDSMGRFQVRLCGGKGVEVMKGVHRLVAEAFLGPRPEGYHTRHLNGVPTDNHVGNLAYGTGSENQIDCYRYGSKSSAGKLLPDDVSDIRERLAKGETQRSVAARYGVSQSSISRIATGSHFGWLPAEGGAF